MLDQPNDWIIKCAVPGTNIDLWMILKKDISVLMGAKCKVRRPQWYMRCKGDASVPVQIGETWWVAKFAVYWRGSNRPRNWGQRDRAAIWQESRVDPDNVKSRIRCVILLNECPIIWSSHLNPSICTSAMMAECHALSAAMREVLPLRNTVPAIGRGLQIDESWDLFRPNLMF